MLDVRLIPPSEALRGVVRHFRLSEGRLDGGPVHWALAARPDQFLEFYLADPYRVVGFGDGAVRRVAPAVVVGPHTRRIDDLVLQGTIRVFTIHFQPWGFHRVFGVAMRELADRALAAEDVLGSGVHLLHEQLHGAPDDGARVAAAEAFLRRWLSAAPAHHPVARAAAHIVAAHGACDVAAVARRVHMGTRQLERRFLEEVGVSPKMLGRLARLQHALRLRRAHPEASWSRIAAEAGYADQAHMGKDFRALAGEAPSRFVEDPRPARMSDSY
jgi:AraC-like DNA-binding protein